MNRALGIAESALTSLLQDSAVSSIWIIGSPRSGTTLLYQVLVNRYELTYFSNLTARFYQAPTIATWLERSLLPTSKRSVEYRSQLGKTSSWAGPNEAAAFWYRWFPKGKHVYVPPGTTPEADLEELRREICGMGKATGAPVLFKNTYNSMRIAPIVEAFPKARFLVCRRNPIDTAQSILSGRITATGDKNTWWSLPPREITKIRDHPPCEQVVEQVYYISQQIEEDRQRFGTERFLDVDYESLCRDTQQTLSSIHEYLGAAGIVLKITGEVPSQFPVSRGQKVSSSDYGCIVQTAKRLWE